MCHICIMFVSYHWYHWYHGVFLPRRGPVGPVILRLATRQAAEVSMMPKATAICASQRTQGTQHPWQRLESTIIFSHLQSSPIRPQNLLSLNLTRMSRSNDSFKFSWVRWSDSEGMLMGMWAQCWKLEIEWMVNERLKWWNVVKRGETWWNVFVKLFVKAFVSCATRCALPSW